MRGVHRALLVSIFFVVCCGTDERSSTTSSIGTAADPVSSPAATTPAEETVASCPEGASIDPPAEELEQEEGQRAKSIGAQMNRLRDLISRYPQSSMLRVKAAKLSLGPPPAGSPTLSQQHLEIALKMHRQGCKLPEALEWDAQESLGLAYMLQKNYSEALKVFQQNSKRWPTIPQSRFNQATAHCRLKQIDECLQAFTESLQIADDEEPPEYINQELTAYHFVHQSRQASDLAALRADSRYEEAIEPHLKKTPRRRRGKRR